MEARVRRASHHARARSRRPSPALRPLGLPMSGLRHRRCADLLRPHRAVRSDSAHFAERPECDHSPRSRKGRSIRSKPTCNAARPRIYFANVRFAGNSNDSASAGPTRRRPRFRVTSTCHRSSSPSPTRTTCLRCRRSAPSSMRTHPPSTRRRNDLGPVRRDFISRHEPDRPVGRISGRQLARIRRGKVGWMKVSRTKKALLGWVELRGLEPLTPTLPGRHDRVQGGSPQFHKPRDQRRNTAADGYE